MKLHSETGVLTPIPPYDFAKTLEFLGAFGPIQDEQALSEDSFTKAIIAGGEVVAFRVVPTGDIEYPQLEYELLSNRPISASTKVTIEQRITSFLGLNDDLKPFYQIGFSDPDFASIIDQLYGYHQVRFLTPFECACWAILSQRNTMRIAHNYKQMLIAEFGKCVEIDGAEYWAFPEPAAVAVANYGYIRTFIRNGRRAEFIVDAARAFVDADEDFLASADYRDAEVWLRKIKGIGEWSAAFILLRGLGRTERIPFGEKRLVEPASIVYGKGHTMTFDEIGLLAKGYGPYQGYWGHYLRAAFI